MRVLTDADYVVADTGYDTPCWIWRHARGNAMGHGKVMFRKKKTWAHRVMWMQHNGPVPDGLELDHLCRVPPCINPDHIEAVTHAENLLRGDGTKVTQEIYDQILSLRATGLSHRRISEQVAVSKSTVGDIVAGKRWSHLAT